MRLLFLALALAGCGEMYTTGYPAAGFYPPPPVPYTDPNLFGLTGANAAIADGGRGMAQIPPTPPTYICGGTLTVTCYPF